MTGDKEILSTSKGQSFKMFRAMVGIASACAFLIAFTYEATEERIAMNKAQALEKAIFEVIEGINSKMTFSFDGNSFNAINEDQMGEARFYAGYDQSGKLKGIAIEASGLGFADIIKILYTYDPHNEEIIGFKVLETKETPGLGDKIEKEEHFLRNFDGLSVEVDKQSLELLNEIRTVKQGQKKNPWEIDGITGATISSKAIGDIIAESSSKWIPNIYKNIKSFQTEEGEMNE